MAVHRYWRIYVTDSTASAGNNQVKLIFDSLEGVLCWKPSSGAGHFLTLVAL